MTRGGVSSVASALVLDVIDDEGTTDEYQENGGEIDRLGLVGGPFEPAQMDQVKQTCQFDEACDDKDDTDDCFSFHNFHYLISLRLQRYNDTTKPAKFWDILQRIVTNNQKMMG